MPSALETLVKILKLEREQGLKNSAVIGGLAAFGNNWSSQAHNQSRRPEQHVLVEELTDILNNYDQIESKNDRLAIINYAMDRITGRAGIPQEYMTRLELYQNEPQESQNPVEAPPLEKKREPTEESGSMTVESKSGERQDKRNKPQEKLKSKQPSRREKQRGNARNSEDDNEADEIDHNGRVDEFTATYSGVLDIPQEQRLTRPPRSKRKAIGSEEAADLMRGLKAGVKNVKGVGDKLETNLQKLGIESINDMIFFLPRRYDDYTQLTQISKLQPNEVVTIIGTVRKTEIVAGRNNRRDFAIDLDDGSGILGIRFFNQHYLSRIMYKGM